MTSGEEVLNFLKMTLINDWATWLEYIQETTTFDDLIRTDIIATIYVSNAWNNLLLHVHVVWFGFDLLDLMSKSASHSQGTNQCLSNYPRPIKVRKQINRMRNHFIRTYEGRLARCLSSIKSATAHAHSTIHENNDKWFCSEQNWNNLFLWSDSVLASAEAKASKQGGKRADEHLISKADLPQHSWLIPPWNQSETLNKEELVHT